jgi:hypothetical protein
MKKDYSISNVSCGLGDFLKSVVDYFFPRKQKLSGTLFVSGKGSLEFKFKTCPESVLVFFADEVAVNPCDPGSEDIVDWQISCCCHHHCHLVINWEVNGTRTITWKVC